MALKKKSGSPVSYLDEVPFKISDKYLCPAKVGLPAGLPDGDAVLATMQFDFSLEREVLAHYVDDGGEKTPQPPVEDSGPSPSGTDPIQAGHGHDAILTPLPASSLDPRNAQPPQTTTEPDPGGVHLKLSDFEQEEDPFDKLELKTLDDKEELRSILQSHQPPAGSVPEGTATHVGPSRDSSPPPLATSTSFPAQQCFAYNPNMDRLHTPVSTRGGLETYERSCSIDPSLTFPKQSHPADRDPNPPGYGLLPLHLDLQQNHTALPALPKSQATVAAPDLNNGAQKQNKMRLAGPPRVDALIGLTSEERQCIKTIVAMGYSQESVLRAMLRQGKKDVEQVLDYLVVHGSLCERGFDPREVEESLEMFQGSEEKALRFLELMSWFCEMGFERKAIKEVLLVHGNDQDKALEDLIARAAPA